LISHAETAARYEQLLIDIKSDNFELLDILHHLTSGGKSVFTQIANDGLYTIRQSLGGAGYSAWSGIPMLIESFNPAVTYEGDNTVMAQQSARYLQKLYSQAKNGEKLVGVNQIFDYLNDIDKYSAMKCTATSV